MLLIPGGEGNRPLLHDEHVLDWVRNVDAHSTWTTSVCTGSLVLGAAGVLEGKRATSHWAYRDALREYGAEPVAERVVEDGKVMTAAGVSAGIDTALTLAARLTHDDVARAIQLGIEYDPDPPFNAGSPEKAATTSSTSCAGSKGRRPSGSRPLQWCRLPARAAATMGAWRSVRRSDRLVRGSALSTWFWSPSSRCRDPDRRVSALAIRLTSHGPRACSVRSGSASAESRSMLVKFRTMVVGDNPVFPDAGRITRVGRFLRRLSFDEIPQLLNIIRGEIERDRPAADARLPGRALRRSAAAATRGPPGVTGWAQLKGRNEIPWADRIELDLEYIDQIQSPLADVKILVRSMLAALRGGGVEGHPGGRSAREGRWLTTWSLSAREAMGARRSTSSRR